MEVVKSSLFVIFRLRRGYLEELKKLQSKAFVGYGLSFGGFILGMLFMFMDPVLGFGMCLCGMVGLIVVSATTGSKYKLAYKESICKGVIAKIFDVEEYRPNEGFEREFIKDTYLSPMGNRFYSDDYIRGNYQGVVFERSDVCIQNVTSNGKTTTTVTYFQGSWTVFTFPKKISTYLMIREKEFLSGGRPGGIFSNAPKTDKVLFEDVAFNEAFDVYAEDEHDAFYVLTPQMIERIKGLEALIDGRMTIGIVNEKLHILFNNGKNALEPSLFREISEEDYQLVEQEMQKIVDIMHCLQLLKER